MLSLISGTNVFLRSEIDGGYLYAVKYGRKNLIRLYLIVYPFVLGLFLVPAFCILAGIQSLQNFGLKLPLENLVPGFFLIIFGGVFYISLFWTSLGMKRDGFRFGEIQKMRDFSVNFSVNKHNIDLKNTPQARVIQVKDIVNFTIRDQSAPDHYRNIKKQFLMQRMRLNSAVGSGYNAERILSFNPIFEFLMAPKKYDVCLETDSDVVVLGHDMNLKDSKRLVEAIINDASMTMVKKPKSKNFTETYVLS